MQLPRGAVRLPGHRRSRALSDQRRHRQAMTTMRIH
jgi:hypothetical protein